MTNTSSRVKGFTVFAVIAIGAMLFHSAPVHGQIDKEDHDSRIERGIDIAPVPLNLVEKIERLWE